MKKVICGGDIAGANYVPRPFDLSYFLQKYVFQPVRVWPFSQQYDRNIIAGKDTAMAEREF